MKFLSFLKIIPTILLVLWANPGTLQAAIFNPTDANQLQADLNTAAANGEDDTINLPGNTLNTNDNGAGATFTYTSAEDNHLTIVGQGSDVSRLDGNNARLVLDLRISSTTAQVILTELAIVNGDGISGGTGGIIISNLDGGISISHCLFDNNNHSTGSFAIINIDSNGPITIEDNTFSNSTAADNFGFGNINSNLSSIAFNRNVVSNIEATTGSFGGPNITAFESLTFNDNSLSDITAGDSFGGGNITAGNTIEFNRNTLTRHNAITGSFGGFNISANGSATVSQNTFSEGGAGMSFGGPNINASQNLNFSNNTIQEINAGMSFGGANINANNALTFNNNTITDNHAPAGFGGVNVNSGSNALEMLNNTIAGNSSIMGSFGGLSLNLGSIAALVANNIIVNNMSQGTAGGMLINANNGTVLDFINNTFNGNISDGTGGGLFLFLSSDNSETNIYNNIIFGNTATTMGDDVYIENSSAANATLRVFNNDFSEFCLEAQASCDVTILGANQGANINEDPLFIDALAGNYYLGAGSPAIDAGTAGAPHLPATDHDGNPRIFGAEPDMGALESTPMILVDPLSHDFGSLDIDQEDSVVITITNIGSVTLDVSAMNLSDTLNYILNVSGGPTPCGTDTPTLNPGENCTVEIFFGPDSVGTLNAILTITSNDPNQTSIEVTLFGVGTAVGGAVFFSGGSCGIASNSPASLNQGAAWMLLALTLGMFWYRRRRDIA